MGSDHAAEEDLVMLYYRENGRSRQLQAHLDECPSCREAYRSLVRVLDACNDLPVPEPQPAFEARMWNKLEPQLSRCERGASRGRSCTIPCAIDGWPRRPWRRCWSWRFSPDASRGLRKKPRRRLSPSRRMAGIACC